MTPEPLTCGFCAKNKNEVEVMIKTNIVNICSECIEDMQERVKEKRLEKLTEAAGG